MFTRLETNLKGLGEVQLTPHMIIEAPCGGRKSAVLEAITLALLEGVYDLEGRPWVKDPGTLCESLGDATGYLWVRLWRDDGACYKWSATNGKGLERYKPDGWEQDVVPLAALDAAISGSDTKAYQNLLSMFRVSFPLEDLSALLDEQYPAYQALTGQRQDDQEEVSEDTDDFSFDEDSAPDSPQASAQASPGQVTVEVLIHARELAKERVTACQKEIRAYDQASRAVLGEKPLPSDLTTARARLSEAESKLAAAPRRAQNAVSAEEAQKTLADIVLHGKAKVQRLSTVQEQIQALEARLPTLRDAAKNAATSTPSAVARYAAQALVYRYLHGQIQEKTGTDCGCPTCGASVNRLGLLTRLARVITLSEEKRAETQRAENAPGPSKALHTAEAQITQLQGEVSRLTQEAAALRTQHQRVKAQIALSEQDTQSFDPGQLQRLEHARDEAKRELDMVNQRDAAWKSRAALEAKAKTAREQKARFEGLAQKLDAAVDTLVRRQLAQITTRVQEFMPEGWEIAIQDEPFRVGLLHDGRRVTASGAQRNAILLAVCAAAYPSAVLIPPERSYDDNSLTRIATGLGGSSCQIFLTTTSPSVGEIPGWTRFQPSGSGKGPTSVDPGKTPAKRGRPKKVRAEEPALVDENAAARDRAMVAEIAAQMARAVQEGLGLDIFAETDEPVLPS